MLYYFLILILLSHQNLRSILLRGNKRKRNVQNGLKTLNYV